MSTPTPKPRSILFRDPRTTKAVEVDKLVISPAQRNVDMKRVKRYIRDWDWNKAEAISVVPNGDGTYTVVEGQHRVRALQITDPKATILCVILDKMPEADQAGTALGIAVGRRPTSAVEKFKLALTSGNPYHVAAQAVLEDHGVDISGTAHSPRTTSAAGAIVKIAQGPTRKVLTPAQGADLLDDTLNVIFGAWPTDPVGRDHRLIADILEPIAVILTEGVHKPREVQTVLTLKDYRLGPLLALTGPVARRKTILSTLRSKLDDRKRR